MERTYPTKQPLDSYIIYDYDASQASDSAFPAYPSPSSDRLASLTFNKYTCADLHTSKIFNPLTTDFDVYEAHYECPECGMTHRAPGKILRTAQSVGRGVLRVIKRTASFWKSYSWKDAGYWELLRASLRGFLCMLARLCGDGYERLPVLEHEPKKTKKFM